MDQQFCQSAVAVVTDLRNSNSNSSSSVHSNFSSTSSSYSKSSSLQEAAANKDNEILLDKQRSTLKYQIMKANELASSGNVSVFYKQRSPDGLQPEFVPILPNKSAITSSNSSEEDQSSHQKVPQQIGVDSKAAVTTPITYANRPAVSHVSNNHPVPSSTSAAVIKTHTDITEEASLQQVLEQKKALTVTQVNKAPVSKPPVQTNQQQKLVRSPGQAKSPQKSAQPQQVKVPIVQHQQGKPQVVQHQQGKSPVVPHQQGKPQVVQHQQGKSPVVQHQQGKSPVVQHQQQGKSPVVQHQQQGKSPVVQHQQQGKSPVVQQHQQQGKSPVVQQQQVKQIVQSGGGRLQPVQVKPKVTPIQAVKTVVQSLPTPVQAKKLLTVHFKPNQIQGKQQQQQPIAQQIVQGNALQNKPPQQSTSPVKQVNVQSKPVQNQFRVQTVNKPLQPSQVSAGKQQQQQTYAPPQKSFQPPPPQQTPPPPPPPPPPPQLPKSVQLTPANSSAANSSVQQPTARINVQTAASTFNVTSKRPNTTAPTADNSASPAKRTTLLQDIERNHLAPPSSLTERCRKSYQSTKKKTKVVPSLTDADINKFKLPSHVAAQVLQQAKQLNQQSKPVFQLKHSPVGGVTPFPPVTATVLPAGLSQAITLLTNQNKVATTVSTPSATETPPPAQTTTTSGAEKQLNIPFQQIPENNQTFKIIVVTNEKNWSFLMDGSGTQVAEALAQAGLREEVGRAIMESTLRQGAKTPQILQVVDGKSGQAVQQTQSQVMEKEEESAEVSPHDGSPTPSKSETEIYREGRLALCHHCGFSSPTYDFCTRCKTKLPPDVKSICLNPVLPELQSNVLVKRTSEVAVAVADSPKKRQKVSKKKKVEEPVCLTISSDDEDANDSKSNNFKLPGLDAVDEPGAAINQDPAITQSAMMKEPVIADEEEEEEEGVKDGEFQDQMESDMCGEMGAMKGEFDNLNSSDTNSEWPVAMDCRTVRIGSYKVVPNDRVYMTLRGIIINIPAIDCESVRVYIPWQSIVKILAHFGKGMPVLFIYTTASMGAKIRKMLGMTDKTNFPYFDPASANESQKRITLLPEDMSTECSTTLKKLFVNLQKTEYDELSQHEANAILVQASPKEVQNQVQKANVVPRLPTDIQTIMVYPPPPAKGGIPINTEDYACLGEDQFLNDVIIDFYLKYLHEHYLCKSDQTRTHILSTFFYKRLTTKPTTSRRSLHNPVENDPKATAAEKRHSRVKSWTKHVDIFKKDFIIIPINEHSHWFLAVICFPGLTSPVDFETNQPIDVAADTKAATSKTKPDSTDSKSDMMAGKTSLVIGSTTITALGGSVTVQAQAGAVAGPGPDTVTLLQSEEEDRDEADGEDEDFDQASSEEEVSPLQQDTDTSAIKNEIDDKKEPEPSVEEQEQESPEAAKEEKRKRSRKKEPRMPIKQPCILIFDSLATASRAKVVATLRDYLKVEYKVKHGVERQFTKEFMKGASPKVPQQTNYTDCGLYVLQYVEAFFQAPITDYHIPMKMLQEWFGVDVVNRKRYDIQQLLHKLMGEQGIDFSTLNLPDLNLAPFPHGLVDYPSSEDEMMAEEGEEEEEEEYQEYGEAYRAMCEDARFNGYRDEEEEDEDDDEEHGGGGDHRRRLTVIGDEEMDCDAEFDEEEEEEEMEQEVEEGLDEEEEDCEEEEEDEEGGLGREMCDEELMDEMVPNVVGLKSYRIPRLNQQSHREDIKMNQSVSIIMPGSISDNNCDSRATSNNDE